MRRAAAILFLMLCCGWVFAQQQHFPYNVSVQTVAGHCYDDAHLIFTLTDNNGNEIQIDPQTHNAVNIGQYPLYNVQYHYQNVSGGLGIQYDYNNDIMLPAGTYIVGVRGYIGGNTLVDTTIYNIQVMTSYSHMEASSMTNICTGYNNGVERYGYWPSFHCKDVGRIQLHITQGSFPYEVTILDEQQDTVRHTVFQHRVGSSNSIYSANYRDYYNFDNLPIGTYSIKVSDSCGYEVSLSFTIPDVEPMAYYAGVTIYNSTCPDTSVVPFYVERRKAWNVYSNSWYDNIVSYVDSILLYRFINPGNDTTEWKNVVSSVSNSYGSTVRLYDTLPNYCVIFHDTVKVQFYDLCLDSLMTFNFKFNPQFKFFDSLEIVQISDTIIPDTCAVIFPSGISTQTYKIGGDTWTYTNSSPYGGAGYYPNISFRYYKCPLSYNVWSLPDSTLLGHSQSDEFTGLGTWVTFGVDTSIQVHVSVTDAQGCQIAEKDTVLVYDTEPIDSLLFWFETHNDIDDDGKNHCCSKRYLWIQEHGVDANTFRRNMTLRLIESPLYNQFNFTAVRQDGVWTITPDDPNNHSTYVQFSYEDGWRATVRDSSCLAPGRYVFEVSTDCGIDTIIKEWAGYYYDSISYPYPAQYEIHQVCDQIVVTQMDPGLVNYVYLIDPAVSNDEPTQLECGHSCSAYCSSGGSHSTVQGKNVLTFSLPGTYVIHTYSYNHLTSYNVSSYAGECFGYAYNDDTVTIAFSYLDFDMAAALLCDASATTGIVTAQAINGNAPYTYTLYNQWGATGNVIASNSTGFFDNVPMTEGQHLSVQVTDSCSTNFSVNLTTALLTHGSLVWEEDASSGPHCAGDTVQLTAMYFPPPATYQWSGPNGFSSTSQTIDAVLPNYSENDWFTVEILNSDICGMSIFDSILVPMAPDPQVTIMGDTIVCPGSNVSLTFVPQGAGQVSFDFLHSNGHESFTINTNETLVQSYPIQSGDDFWVENVSDENCSSHAPVDTFHVHTYATYPGPTEIYDTICQGSGYEANGFTLTAAETDTVGALTRLRIVETNGCTDTVTLHLTVNPLAAELVEVNACDSYTWNGVTYSESGTHKQYYTAANGCDSVVTLLLTISETPQITVTVSDDTVCPGSNVSLHALVNSAVTVPVIAVGDILCTDGSTVKPANFATSGKTAMGVVFYVDSTRAHGWAVHLHDQSTKVRWSSSQVDVPGVSNVGATALPDFSGYANTVSLWAAGDSVAYPAAHTVDLAHGWYLPDIGQMSLLFSNIVEINASLSIVDGTPFPMDIIWYYWSSSEDIPENYPVAWIIKSDGNIVVSNKTFDDHSGNNHRVRSIRDF